MRCRGLLFLLIWAVGSVLTAYSQVTTGTISGTVKDSTGAVLPGTSVVILNEDTGVARTVETDAAGRYSAPQLSLGNYRLTASLEGFQTEVRSGIVLTVGRSAVVDLQLAVGAVTQTVEITGEAPLVQTTEATVGYLVEDRTIRDLPLNGRDVTQLILLNPGVISAVNSRAENATVGFGKRISISGSRGEDNSYLLDGSYINDFSRHIPAGPTGALLGAETVREFQVLTNAFSAQYGRAMGGVFNAVSKSGANDWHGSLYEYLRNSALDARSFFDRQVWPFRRNHFGGTIGGPVARDRTFFFVAYEAMRESLTQTKITVVPDENARRGILPNRTVTVSEKVAPFLQFFPLPNGRRFIDGTAEFIFPNRTATHEDFGQGRFDHQFSASDSAFARFTGSNSQSVGVLDFPGSVSDQSLNTRLLTLSETHIFSARALNTLRFSFSRVVPISGRLGVDAPPGVPTVPGQQVPGMNPGSGATGFSDNLAVVRWLTNRFNYQDDVNLNLGSHALKFGGMLERLQLNADQPNRPNGTWGFASLENFLLGIPDSYRGTPPQFGSSIRGMRQWFYGPYLQDDWQVRPSLTLNLGLRWDRYSVPTEVNGLIVNLRHREDREPTIGDPYWKSNAGNLAPRFGFAWSPFQSGRTSVRGGWGLFYVPVDPGVWFRAMARMAPLFPEFSFSNPPPQLFPDALATIRSFTVSSFGTVYVFSYDNMRTPHAMQYNLNVQQQLGRSSVLTVGYVGNRGLNQTSLSNYNMAPAVHNGNSYEFPLNATKFNPNFECICYYSNDGDSWYNALTVAFQRRFSGGFQTQVSYTYSKTINLSDGNNTGQNVTSNDFSNMKYTYDRKVVRGPSGYGVPMALVVNYSYDLPLGRGWSGVPGRLLSGWQLSGIFTAQRGQPFTVTAGTPAALSSLEVGTRSPNAVAGRTMDDIIKGGVDQYFDPTAYTAPRNPNVALGIPGELGNVGRNTLIGPGLVKWDFSLAKNISLTERWRLQFRSEFFNLLNHANFAGPASSLFTAGGGRVGSAGTITKTLSTSRQIQFALRLTF